MSETTHSPAAQSASSSPSEPQWRLRQARSTDAAVVASAVRDLLLELGGTPSALSAMTDAASTLIDDPTAGVVLLAESRAEMVGVLAVSWQLAIHVPGRYALIQDLWVHPDWRDRAVGSGLLAALFELAADSGLQRVEVGLPRESFTRFAATEAFYVRNGFQANGPRMRKALP
jgi:GNAT superfamily N-acetyltransferase